MCQELMDRSHHYKMPQLVEMLHESYDMDLCEDEIIHIEIWKKHKDTISLLYITEIKLQKL